MSMDTGDTANLDILQQLESGTSDDSDNEAGPSGTAISSDPGIGQQRGRGRGRGRGQGRGMGSCRGRGRGRETARGQTDISGKYTLSVDTDMQV